MSTRKITNTDKTIGKHAIRPMVILDMTRTNEEISVVMKVTENKQSNDVVADAKQEILDSPWHEDDLAKALVSKTKENNKMLDPVARLRKVNEILGRQ